MSSTIEKALEKLRGGQTETQDPVDPVSISFEQAKNDSHSSLEFHGKKEDEKPEQKTASRRLNLDLERLAKSGFLTPESGRTQLAEEMRHIKRPLLINAANGSASSARNSNLIMVTSSRPSEGKSYTSLNLAMSIAKERDKTVLLVDADVAKPGVTRMLNFEAEKGLVDYLIDDSLGLSDVMVKTNVPSFRFIPAGRRHIHSTELLASESMMALAQDLSKRYPDRIVLFDSPPLLATSEASVLAGLVGQILMVVEAERTTKQELEEALAQIGQNDDQYIGLVLNKARGSFGTDYYGYYGSYGD